MRRSFALLTLALGLIAASCGQSVDFSEKADIPGSFKLYESPSGVSFAVPKALGEAKPVDGDTVRFGDETAFVELQTRAGKGDGFEGYVRSYETVATTLGKAKVEITEQEVPGAEAARLFEIVSPPKKNANAAELRSRVLIVRRGGDVLVLSAGTQ